MKTTPVFGYPYPEAGDHTRTWEYWQALAQRADEVGSAVAYYSAKGLTQKNPGGLTFFATNMSTATVVTSTPLVTADLVANTFTLNQSGMWRMRHMIYCKVNTTYRWEFTPSIKNGGVIYTGITTGTWTLNGSLDWALPAGTVITPGSFSDGVLDYTDAKFYLELVKPGAVTASVLDLPPQRTSWPN